MQQIYPKIYQPAPKKGSTEVKRKRKNWFANWQRGKKFAKAPSLSSDEQERLIKEFFLVFLFSKLASNFYFRT